MPQQHIQVDPEGSDGRDYWDVSRRTRRTIVLHKTGPEQPLPYGTNLLKQLYICSEHGHCIHKLTSLHMSAVDNVFFFLPSVLSTLASGILSLISNAELSSMERNANTLTAAGTLAIFSGFWQSVAKEFGYQGHAQAHKETSDALQSLWKSIEVELAAKRDLEGSKNEEDEEDFPRACSDRLIETLAACDSVVPGSIDSAFSSLRSDHDMTFRPPAPAVNLEVEKDLFVKQGRAFKALETSIMATWAWPLIIPRSRKVLNKTLLRIYKKWAIEENFGPETDLFIPRKGDKEKTKPEMHYAGFYQVAKLFNDAEKSLWMHKLTGEHFRASHQAVYLPSLAITLVTGIVTFLAKPVSTTEGADVPVSTTEGADVLAVIGAALALVATFLQALSQRFMFESKAINQESRCFSLKLMTTQIALNVALNDGKLPLDQYLTYEKQLRNPGDQGDSGIEERIYNAFVAFDELYTNEKKDFGELKELDDGFRLDAAAYALLYDKIHNSFFWLGPLRRILNPNPRHVANRAMEEFKRDFHTKVRANTMEDAVKERVLNRIIATDELGCCGMKRRIVQMDEKFGGLCGCCLNNRKQAEEIFKDLGLQPPDGTVLNETDEICA